MKRDSPEEFARLLEEAKEAEKAKALGAKVSRTSERLAVKLPPGVLH